MSSITPRVNIPSINHQHHQQQNATNGNLPPPGIVDMGIPYEGSDYESDTDYVTSVSSSFSDVTGPENMASLHGGYDMIENHVSTFDDKDKIILFCFCRSN